MSRDLLASHVLGDTLVRYVIDSVTRIVGLEMIPLAMEKDLTKPRETLRGEPFIDALPGADPWPARPVESLIQFKIVGDPYPGAFAQGHTLRNSETHRRFHFSGQEILRNGESITIKTNLSASDGCVASHQLSWKSGDAAFTSVTSLTNGSCKPLILEMLSSFSLCYNETAGLGCDHPDSQGEGLRCQIDGTYRFFDLIRERLPDLGIENCSSGGHRLEPSMLARTAMSSFSDAHELPEIPIIAANLHRLLLPRQNQIWAVLHATDSLQRIRYSLAATFLGRMCISGGIEHLPEASWQLTREAIALYQKAAPVIKNGISRRFGGMGESWRHPQGWQAVLRTSGDRALVVVHTFAAAPDEISIPLSGDWNLTECFTHGFATHSAGHLMVKTGGDFQSAVFLMQGANE